MPWAVTALPDRDNARDGDAVGSYVAIYSDDDLFAASAFTASERFNFKTDFTEVAAKLNEQLNQERQRRQLSAKIASAMESALNNGK